MERKRIKSPLEKSSDEIHEQVLKRLKEQREKRENESRTESKGMDSRSTRTP